MRSIQISRFGGPEVLQPIQALSATPLPAGTVRIQVQAAGVNFADLMMRMGLYPEAPRTPFIPGYEIAGVVQEIGPGSDTALQVGDRVLAGTRFGGYTSEILLPCEQVRKTPACVSTVEAASIPVNFLTAWIALHEMARVRSGDRVVIPSAAGGVGTAAIQIAAHSGAHVTGLISELENRKVEKLKSLGAAEVLDYAQWERSRAASYSIILDATGGQSLSESFRHLAPGGRLIHYGVSSAVSGNTRSLMRVASLLVRTFCLGSFQFQPFQLMMHNKGIFGLNLLKYFENPELLPTLNSILDQILKKFENRTFIPVIGKTFPLEEAAQAHLYLQSRKNIGKVVLTA